MAPLYPLSSSSSESDASGESFPVAAFPAAVTSPPVVAEVTELAAVKEFVTLVWVLPVQLDSLSPSETSSARMSSSSWSLPSDDDGSLSSGSKYFSVLFQLATALLRKAGVVFIEPLSLLPLLDEDDEGRFTELVLVFALSDSILALRDFLAAALIFFLWVLSGILLGAVSAEEEGHSVTSCDDFFAPVSSRSREIAVYRAAFEAGLAASVAPTVAAAVV